MRGGSEKSAERLEGEKAAAIAWWNGNYRGQTHPVKQKAANAWGLYDMIGNVAEWCQDWYRHSLNEADVVEALKQAGIEDGGGNQYRVLRGGSWLGGTGILLRSSGRGFDAPSYRYGHVGFRVVLELGSGG